MSKRLTDTGKWKRKFIRSLPSEYKLLWLYILDECDAAGVWVVDFDLANFILGIQTEGSRAMEYFGEKIRIFDGGEKWFIPSFLTFQYGEMLNPTSPVHRGVIKILEKYGLSPERIKVEGEEDAPKRRRSAEKPKEEKITYAPEVRMSEREYSLLVEARGEPFIRECIKKLSHFKISRGKTYKSDFHAIHSWVIDAVAERSKSTGGTKDEKIREFLNS